jgi:hypothetical protein
MDMFVHIALLVYVGLVVGIYLKFLDSGVKVRRRSLFFVSALPFIIAYLHGGVMIKCIKERRSVRLKQVFFPALEFPLLIGVFIELFLEKQAQAVAARSRSIDKTRRANKKIRSINSARKSVEFDFNIIRDATNLYKKKLMPKEAV